ncbi:DUF4148 domain-containing protein [Paraburkholderia acidisoli]|uniref:DUF4148 domain-containing protein n=1 Tax=Paraburkholderia acidisoli TaxID=2571748 RepID=A0A7Z2JKP2_9BURK|nr:DUF4148 domain-containing protein [Paraburkholderia acidisoli]QGZ66489.1 DUF4148 domain-containing protein [Paraburkholderia acidisoli]
MNLRHTLIASFAALACFAAASASAQGLTRAEVRQQLIEAEANGSQFVTDTSYPDVSPVFAQQVAHAKAATPPDAMGAAMQGSSDAGAPRMSQCVGPQSFCNLYSGG